MFLPVLNWRFEHRNNLLLGRDFIAAKSRGFVEGLEVSTCI